MHHLKKYIRRLWTSKNYFVGSYCKTMRLGQEFSWKRIFPRFIHPLYDLLRSLQIWPSKPFCKILAEAHKYEKILIIALLVWNGNFLLIFWWGRTFFKPSIVLYRCNFFRSNTLIRISSSILRAAAEPSGCSILILIKMDNTLNKRPYLDAICNLALNDTCRLICNLV